MRRPRALLGFALCFAPFMVLGGACHSKTEVAKGTDANKTTTTTDPKAAAEHHDGPALAYAGDTDAATARLVVGGPDDFAVVTVDGATRGTTPRGEDNPIMISAGAHRVELRFLPSGPTKSFDITVAAHETYKLTEH